MQRYERILSAVKTSSSLTPHTVSHFGCPQEGPQKVSARGSVVELWLYAPSKSQASIGKVAHEVRPLWGFWQDPTGSWKHSKLSREKSLCWHLTTGSSRVNQDWWRSSKRLVSIHTHPQLVSRMGWRLVQKARIPGACDS